MELKTKKQKGFTIAEMIIAIAVLSFGIVLIYGAFYTAFNATFSAGPRFIATYLAQEGQEITRNIRDNNFINNATWSLGLTGSPCSTGCQADYKTITYPQLTAYSDTFLGLDSDNFYSYDINGTPTIFKRKITISPVPGNNDILKVNVLVTWTYSGQGFSHSSDEYLYNKY